MAIGFLEEPDRPLEFAIELHRKADERNQPKNEENGALQVIKVCIGIHGGLAFKFDDIQGNQNIWGPGVVITKRIMDIGEVGHTYTTEHKNC